MNPALDAYPADRVVLREVGLRDGLQMVGAYPSTAAKTDWLDREFAAGVTHFEVGSFLPAKGAPQFADVRDIIATCDALNLHSAALALNERGASDAVHTAVSEIVTVVSVTEEHSQANARRSRSDAMALVRKTVELAQTSGDRECVGCIGCRDPRDRWVTGRARRLPLRSRCNRQRDL